MAPWISWIAMGCASDVAPRPAREAPTTVESPSDPVAPPGGPRRSDDPALATGITAAEGILDSLEGAWACLNSAADHEFLELYRDPPYIRVEWVRQVGADDDVDVPYPTVCRWAEYGGQFWVARSGDADLPWSLHYVVDRVELVETPDNSEACPTFVDRENADLGEANPIDLDEPHGETLLTEHWTCVPGESPAAP